MLSTQLRLEQTMGAPARAKRGTMGPVCSKAMPEPDLDSLSSALPTGPSQAADESLVPLLPPRLPGKLPSFE